MAAAQIQSLHEYWTNFQLPQLQREMDEKATELANRQDESEMSRKKLVEQSREFRRSNTEAVRTCVSPMFKSFQHEVDALSRRSKSAESAFLSVYKRMIDTPDPCSALEHALSIQKKSQKVADLEIENQQLRETLKEYHEEFADVKNQEVTIKQLREKIREYEETMESTAQAKAKDKEKELSRQYLDKERQLQESQLQVATKLGEAEHRITVLQNALDASQSELFDLKSKFEEESHAKSDEVEMIMNDLERANQRAQNAEKDNSSLMEQLQQARSSAAVAAASAGGAGGGAAGIGKDGGGGGGSSSPHTSMEQAIDVLQRSNLEVELQSKEKEIAALVAEVHTLHASLAQVREASLAQVTALEQELERRRCAAKLMEEQLRQRQDYDELKRELRVLKSIEFQSPSATATAAPDNGAGTTPKSLETLLLEKNKQQQAENTSLKASNADLQARISQLEPQYNEAVQTLTEQKQLIAQLEQDLLSVRTLSSVYRGEGEGSPSAPSSSEAALVADVVKDVIPSSPTSTGGSGMPQLHSPGLHGASAGTSEADSLLPIISSQRERFRMKNQELQGQVVQQQRTVSMLHNEVDKLRNDNIKLYEKIKFLQSYPNKGGTSVDDIESRYSSRYEENLDPFSSFGKKEKLRKYMNLTPYDKITLGLGQFIMSNKTARVFTFFYTMMLHLLVFLVLYKLAHTESCKKDVSSECAKMFSEHMQNIHGQESPFQG